MGKLKELILEKFKVETRVVVNPLVTSLSTTAARVFSNNPNRLGWTITNLGTVVIYIGFTPDVSSTNGIYIDSNGGSMGMIWDQDFEPTGWEIHGIATSGTPNIYSLEIEAV